MCKEACPHRSTYLHSIACSSDLKLFGLPLRKPCIEVRDAIAVPTVAQHKQAVKWARISLWNLLIRTPEH